MPIEVQGPDGQVHPFPDNTPHDVINQRMLSLYPSFTGGSLQPQGLPQAGAATAASGAVMPNMQGVPPPISDDDMMRIGMAFLNPGAAQAIANTPGSLLRAEQAKTVGQNLGRLEERQRQGSQVLEMLQRMGHTADEALFEPPQSGQDPASRRRRNFDPLLGAIGPVDSNDWWQRVREAVNIGDVFGTNQAYNLHNQLLHDIDGIVTAFVGATGGGGNMSDARQSVFQDTIGRMMRATSREDFNKIMADADRIIRSTFNLSPGAVVPNSSSARPQNRGTGTGTGSGQQGSSTTPRPRYQNPATGEIIEWNGTQYVPVQGSRRP